MRKKLPLTQAQKDEIMTLFNQGIARLQIATQLGISRPTVFRHTPITKQSADELAKRNESIKKLYRDGILRKDIEKHLGVSKTIIQRALQGEPRQKITREHIKKSNPLPKIKKREKNLNPQIKKLYRDGILRKDIEKHLGVSRTIVQRALEGEPRQKITREHVKKANPLPKIKKKEKSLNPQIKKLWIEGKTKSVIARELNIGFPRVNQAIIDMGIEDIERAVYNKPKLKTMDRHTNNIKVQINHKTWAYMDASKWYCENKFREFKIKQLGL